MIRSAVGFGYWSRRMDWPLMAAVISRLLLSATVAVTLLPIVMGALMVWLPVALMLGVVPAMVIPPLVVVTV